MNWASFKTAKSTHFIRMQGVGCILWRFEKVPDLGSFSGFAFLSHACLRGPEYTWSLVFSRDDTLFIATCRKQ